jgi:hypothetical protein
MAINKWSSNRNQIRRCFGECKDSIVIRYVNNTIEKIVLIKILFGCNEIRDVVLYPLEGIL